MSIANDIKDDIKAARKIRLPWWGILCLIVGGLPVIWLFDHFGEFNLFLPTFNCVAVLGFTITVKRNLRRHAWFWGTMGILAALHVPLILLVPWGTRWVPALAIAAIDSADLVLMLTIITVVAKFMEGANAPEGPSIGQ